MNTYFITILDGIITGSFCGDINAKFAGFNGHERVTVPEAANIVIGDPVTLYTDDWQRKVDAEPVPNSYEKLTEEEKAEQEIAELKAYLASKDYIGNKIAIAIATGQDVAALVAEYQADLDECDKARARINELESMNNGGQ